MLAKVRRRFFSKNDAVGCVDRYSRNILSGWIASRSNLNKPLTIDVYTGETLIKTIVADNFRQDLVSAGFGDGHHGFEISVDLKPMQSVNDFVVLVRPDHVGSEALRPFNERLRSDRALIEISAEAHRQLFAPQKMRGSNLMLLIGNSDLVLFDVQDLLNFLQVHNSVTGIQRVVSGVVITLAHTQKLFDSLRFCMISNIDNAIDIIDTEGLLAVVQAAISGVTSQDVLRAQVLDLLANAQTYFPEKGQTFFIGGAYWIVPDCGSRLNKLKDKGVIIGTYIYDLIPVTASQWVTDETRLAVTDRLIDILLISDFFLTISNFVKEDLRNLLDTELSVERPIEAVTLPHKLSNFSMKTAVNLKDKFVLGRFVLCVCTLEGRKNHILLFRVWSALIRKYGFDAVPELVLVGKWGWNVETFRSACETSNFLDDKIRIMSGIGDNELAWLYTNCLFTVFPSFVEGWGLPVGESLSFGKLCVTSITSSMPEVGGPFCDYFGPSDYFTALKVIENYIFKPDALAAKNLAIAMDFEPRDWSVFSTSLLNAIIEQKRAIDLSKIRSIVPVLVPLQRYLLTADNLVSNPLVAWTDKKLKFLLVSGWCTLESWGSWASSAMAFIRFKAKDTAGKLIEIDLQVQAPPGISGDLVIQSLSETSERTSIWISPRLKTAKHRMTVPADEIICLALSVSSKPLYENDRAIYFGLTAVAYLL